MLNSEEKKFAPFATKKNSNFVLSEKKILNETKNHNPPFKLNGRSPTIHLLTRTNFFFYEILMTFGYT